MVNKRIAFVKKVLSQHNAILPLDRFRKIQQDTAAINLLYKNGPTFSVKVVDERAHLRLRGVLKNGEAQISGQPFLSRG